MSIIKAENIFLPEKEIDLSKWSVIACDQFTSEPKYWEKLKNYVGGNASALNIILPEVYLQKDNSGLINQINSNMKKYLADGVLEDIGNCFVLINRKTKYNAQRLGLIAAVDLEEYSFAPDSKSNIRATEKTVVERIPPRVEIRKNAIFELPHILLLIDDREEKIIENLYMQKAKLQKLYDFELNMEGGHITGYKVENTDEIIKKFNKLLDPSYIQKTFNTKDAMLLAVGDGNHSLATAKTHWENIRQNLSAQEQLCHPARYALVEIENIHDSGLTFNPIYRVVFNAENNFITGLKNLYKVQAGFDAQIITHNKTEQFKLPDNCPLAVKLVQDYIDGYKNNHPEVIVDYVHGIESVNEICEQSKNAIGITLPALNKNDLFEYVLKNGTLTRKSFSIGEAIEKRYYIEAHKIIK